VKMGDEVKKNEKSHACLKGGGEPTPDPPGGTRNVERKKLSY